MRLLAPELGRQALEAVMTTGAQLAPGDVGRVLGGEHHKRVSQRGNVAEELPITRRSSDLNPRSSKSCHLTIPEIPSIVG